jgi:hypothetical protein
MAHIDMWPLDGLCHSLYDGYFGFGRIGTSGRLAGGQNSRKTRDDQAKFRQRVGQATGCIRSLSLLELLPIHELPCIIYLEELVCCDAR